MPPKESDLTADRPSNTIAMMARTDSIRLLVTTEEKTRIEQAAATARRSMSDWLRLVAEEAIERQRRGDEAGHESTRKVPGSV